MAISFNKQTGAAQKSSVDTVTFVEGENQVRLVGDILARYVYWIPGKNNKSIPFECLSFSREHEKFDNQEKDWIREYHPEAKNRWSYAMQCIQGGKVKLFNLKRNLWDQINVAAEDLGDPTDPDTGWDIVFEKKKTGPLPINVEYQLKTLKCQKFKRPLDDEERAMYDNLRSMDLVMPRPTPDAQKKLLDDIAGNGETESETDEESIEKEFSQSATIS